MSCSRIGPRKQAEKHRFVRSGLAGAELVGGAPATPSVAAPKHGGPPGTSCCLPRRLFHCSYSRAPGTTDDSARIRGTGTSNRVTFGL